MSGLRTLKSEVEWLLANYPDMRDSDEKLYAGYLSRHGITTISVASFLNNFNEYDVSDFESVTRCRRKLVEENPALAPSKKIQALRDERQVEFFDFVKGRD